MRREFAWETVDWTPTQWEKILCSDETWVAGRAHSRIWTTRGENEGHIPSSTASILRRKKVCMF